MRSQHLRHSVKQGAKALCSRTEYDARVLSLATLIAAGQMTAITHHVVECWHEARVQNAPSERVSNLSQPACAGQFALTQ